MSDRENFKVDVLVGIRNALEKANSREQRRYEIAKDVMAAIYANPSVIPGAEHFDIAELSAESGLRAADALLKALEESSDG